MNARAVVMRSCIVVSDCDKAETDVPVRDDGGSNSGLDFGPSAGLEQ